MKTCFTGACAGEGGTHRKNKIPGTKLCWTGEGWERRLVLFCHAAFDGRVGRDVGQSEERWPAGTCQPDRFEFTGFLVTSDSLHRSAQFVFGCETTWKTLILVPSSCAHTVASCCQVRWTTLAMLKYSFQPAHSLQCQYSLPSAPSIQSAPPAKQSAEGFCDCSLQSAQPRSFSQRRPRSNMYSSWRKRKYENMASIK